MKNIAFALAVTLSLCLLSCGGNPSVTPSPQSDVAGARMTYIRRNAHSPEAAADLQALDKALGIMRKMDCSDPRSWYYQGAMHWVPSSISGQNNLCSWYHTRQDIKLGWDNCTHNANSEYNFLVWHRFYIWHFEKIVRELSGKADFALPYWGYTDTTNVEMNRTMPAPFRDPSSNLYESARFDSINQGVPIYGDILSALDLTNLFENRTYSLFNSTIDPAPHGAMHGYIGAGNNGYKMYNPIYQDTTYGMMASVSSAGFDPIFWLHHANIDRIWQQWTDSPRGAPVELDSLIAYAKPDTFTFFGPQGNPIRYTRQQVFDMVYNMDYKYDDQIAPPQAAVAARTLFALSGPETDTLLKAKVGKALSTGKRLDFNVANSKHKQKIALLGAQGATTGKLVVMNIRVSFPAEPQGIYQLYVNLPKGAAPDPKGPYCVGVMTFFGVEHHMEEHEGGMHGHGNEPMSKSFRFDITDEMTELKGLEKQQLSFSIFKARGLPNESITVEEVTITTH